MEKPIEIIALEKELGFELEQAVSEEEFKRKSYYLNKDGQVITLNIVYSQITKFPESIGNLVNLTSLNLYRNQIVEVPNSIGNLINLVYLNLSENQISEIPNSIGNLLNLTSLVLYGNQISQIPDSIRNLVNLTKLSLSVNQISQISDAIGYLVSLKSLDLGSSYDHKFNKISQIPESIGNLVNLESLDLTNNQIHELPTSIANLSRLAHLSIEDNPICENLDYQRFITKIDYKTVFILPALFAYLNEKRSFKTPSSSQILKEEIKLLVGKDYIDTLCEKLIKYFEQSNQNSYVDQARIIRGKWEDLKKDKEIIDREDYHKFSAQILTSLLSLCNEIT